MKQPGPGIDVQYRSRNLSVKVIIGVVAIITIAVFFRAEIGVILLGIGGVTVLFGLVSVGNRLVALLTGVEHWKQERAKTDKMRAEALAARIVIQTNNGLLVDRENSHFSYIPPTAGERKMLPAVIDGEATPAPLDFFTAMLGTQQPYKIIAEQRRGKSYLGMHITDRAVRERREACIVIGTKYDPGEWPNAYRYLIKAELVQAGLTHVINETIKRNEIFKRSPLLRVFLDDWINTAIRYPRLAQEFLELAATEMLTAGIVPYFLLQGDGNDDWGNKKSAMLKNNFTGLWVAGPRDEQGDPIPQLNTAMLKYPGSREELPVRLPQGLPQLGASRLPAPAARAPEPNEEERRVLALLADGVSYRQITSEVWGQFGKYYNDKIDEIRRKYGQANTQDRSKDRHNS